MSIDKLEYTIKILLIGESDVGKTCLLLRFMDNTFKTNHQNTIGVDFKQKVVEISDKLVRIQIWDTAGQERFRTLTKSYYKLANGIILTYDITDKESFDSIRNWIKQIDFYAEKNVKRILVGNKSDKNEFRQVSYEEGENLAREFNISFFETSAKTNKNVFETFLCITKLLLINIDTYKDNSERQSQISLGKNDDNNDNKNSICNC